MKFFKFGSLKSKTISVFRRVYVSSLSFLVHIPILTIHLLVGLSGNPRMLFFLHWSLPLSRNKTLCSGGYPSPPITVLVPTHRAFESDPFAAEGGSIFFADAPATIEV